LQDDEVVVNRGAVDANYIWRILEQEYETWGLKINYRKMEYSGTDHSEELQISGSTIPTVKHFKYFESIVQENGSTDLEIDRKD
jgi:hypothetical protein